jgi:hypothetical protein
MTKLTVAEATSYAQQAGFSGSALTTIIAISQAESGLDTQAINPNDPNGGSYGIVQINGIHFGTQWAGGIMSKIEAFDPALAYRFAYMLSNNGTNFTPWGTYTNGSYLQFMGSSSSPGSNIGALAVSGSTNSSISGLLAWISQPARPVKMITGILLLGIATFMLVSPDAQKAVVQTMKEIGK